MMNPIFLTLLLILLPHTASTAALGVGAAGSDRDLADAASMEAIGYQVDTLISIAYGSGSGSTLGLPPQDQPLAGSIAYCIDPRGRVYLYQRHEKILRVFDTSGALLKKRFLDFVLWDVWVDSAQIVTFDGRGIRILDTATLSMTKQWLIPDVQGVPMLRNTSFLYESYLFVMSFESSESTSRHAYAYDYRKLALSTRILRNDLYLPLTACSACDFQALMPVVADPMGYNMLLGQSEIWIAAAVQPRTATGRREFIVIAKKNTHPYRLAGFGGAAYLSAPRPFHFMAPNRAAYCEVVRDVNTRKPRRLLVCAITLDPVH